MRSKLLLVAFIMMTISLQAFASVTVEEITSKEYMEKNGYSEQTGDMVQISKARVLGEDYYTDREQRYRKNNRFVRFWKALYNYTDPAADDSSFYHHDTKTYSHFKDL